MNFGSLYSFLEIFKRTNVNQNLENDLRVTGPKVATGRLAHRVSQPTGTLACPSSDWVGVSTAPSPEQWGAHGKTTMVLGTAAALPI
jgi:hypothetical protein